MTLQITLFGANKDRKILLNYAGTFFKFFTIMVVINVVLIQEISLKHKWNTKEACQLRIQSLWVSVLGLTVCFSTIS